jgi:hypothetical protein
MKKKKKKKKVVRLDQDLQILSMHAAKAELITTVGQILEICIKPSLGYQSGFFEFIITRILKNIQNNRVSYATSVLKNCGFFASSFR